MQADRTSWPGSLSRPDGDIPMSLPISTAPARAARRRTTFPSWLEDRLRTIRDSPEDLPDRNNELRRNVVGYGISTLAHAAILVLLSLLIFLLPKPEAPVTIDSALGTPFGIEEGLEAVGGFDDELMNEVDESLLDSATLLEPIRPVPDLTDESLFAKTAPASSDGVGGGAEFGMAHFGTGGSELVQGVSVKIGDPQFTLVWDGQADIDLHVLEPGGSHIFWEERHGDLGGELDVDDVDGHGPENVYWVVDRTEAGEVVKGRGPAGEYKWFVEYYGGHGGFTAPTRWKVRVKQGGTVTIHEGTLRQIGDRSRSFTIEIAPSPDRPVRAKREEGMPDLGTPRHRRP